ncbi:MAG: hypothetical protein RLZ42_1120 [Armatimonadota bacterium]
MFFGWTFITVLNGFAFDNCWPLMVTMVDLFAGGFRVRCFILMLVLLYAHV